MATTDDKISVDTQASFNADDGAKILYYKWKSDASVKEKGVVQLIHGLADHAKRYEHFAKFLNSHGYTVYAHDQRGHGITAGQENLGIYEGQNFWKDALGDIKTFNQLIQKESPDTPKILFGHSMGSIMSRNYIAEYDHNFDAVVISGTAPFIKVLGTVGIFLTSLIKFIFGKDSISPFLKSLFFGTFNAQFKPTRTELDWISRDEKVVDVFEADPLRGIDFQTGFFLDILKGFRTANKKKIFQSTSADLPMYFFSGDQDPVGENGKGVEKVIKGYKDSGVKDLTLKLYEGGRHEMLNETNQEEVYNDILAWMNEKILTN